MGTTKKNWKRDAEAFILKETGQRTVLKAMKYLDNLVYGDNLFVELVAKAMEQTYIETFQTLNKAKVENKSSNLKISKKVAIDVQREDDDSE